MRISDCSSDVCSSDRVAVDTEPGFHQGGSGGAEREQDQEDEAADRESVAQEAAPEHLPPVPAAVSFEGVRFVYPDGTEALTGLDMLAPAGKVTALVGPSGAGKSTVLSLIPRFFDVDGGGVRIGGRDLRGLTVTSLRAAIAVVGQEVVLFDDTVAENTRS